MAGLSFIDIVFPQFSGNYWQGGVSLFRSGSVGKLSFYGELVSARVRAGIGENYDVRLKLHSQGKGVQWMECTCQANRRKGEKCSHIAALCLVLDQEMLRFLRGSACQGTAQTSTSSKKNRLLKMFFSVTLRVQLRMLPEPLPKPVQMHRVVWESY
jgi:uncharacterized Zn finger protein